MQPGQNHRVTITRNNKIEKMPPVNIIEKDKLELLIFFNIAVSSVLDITVLQQIIDFPMCSYLLGKNK